MKNSGSAKKVFVGVLFLVAILLLVSGSKYFIDKYFRKTSNTNEIGSNLESSEAVSDKSLRGELPDVFSDKFPVYENAVIDESWETKSEDSHAVSAVWKTNASPLDVAIFYEKELILAGYEVSVLSGDSNSYTITISKDNESGFVGVVRTGGQDTLISVTIAMKED